jgi:hypothetical protein
MPKTRPKIIDRFPDNRPSIAPEPGPGKPTPREQNTPELPPATQKIRRTTIPR